MTIDEHERFILSQIQELQQSYQRAAQPLIKRLIRLREVRPSSTIVVDGEFLEHHKIIKAAPFFLSSHS